MATFRYLCPQCGQAFPEGTAFTRCTLCNVPLLDAASPEETARQFAERLPPNVDVDQLLRSALASQRRGEGIDAALERTIAAQFPGSAKELMRILGLQLDLWQQSKQLSRQQAAEQLAKAESELSVGPDGVPGVRTQVQTEIRMEGLGEFSPHIREEMRRHIGAAISGGTPPPGVKLRLPSGRRIGCLHYVFFAVLAVAMGWCVFVT